MHVGIVDLEINNLTSVGKVFKELLDSGDSLEIIDKGWEGSRPDLVVLPGLGKFKAGMDALKDRDLIPAIKSWEEQGTKIAGICLGMQLLGSSSEESPGIEGLDLIKGKIVKLPTSAHERIPHTGWAESKTVGEIDTFSSLAKSGDFYFVHSYHLIPSDEKNVLSRTIYGESSFVSGVIAQNVIGFQFHPEKSGKKGKVLVSEVIQWARHES
jgi:glutamine amidotransferase